MLKEEIIMRGKQLGFPRLSKKSHDNQATMIATIVQEAIEAEREWWKEHIKTDIEAAKKEEREACAKVCEDLDAHRQVATWYSQAIRARTNAERGEQHERS